MRAGRSLRTRCWRALPCTESAGRLLGAREGLAAPDRRPDDDEHRHDERDDQQRALLGVGEGVVVLVAVGLAEILDLASRVVRHPRGARAQQDRQQRPHRRRERQQLGRPDIDRQVQEEHRDQHERVADGPGRGGRRALPVPARGLRPRLAVPRARAARRSPARSVAADGVGCRDPRRVLATLVSGQAGDIGVDLVIDVQNAVGVAHPEVHRLPTPELACVASVTRRLVAGTLAAHGVRRTSGP